MTFGPKHLETPGFSGGLFQYSSTMYMLHQCVHLGSTSQLVDCNYLCQCVLRITKLHSKLVRVGYCIFRLSFCHFPLCGCYFWLWLHFQLYLQPAQLSENAENCEVFWVILGLLHMWPSPWKLLNEPLYYGSQFLMCLARQYVLLYSIFQ